MTLSYESGVGEVLNSLIFDVEVLTDNARFISKALRVTYKTGD